jgi:ABC-type transport system substrate-binding protein
MYRVTVPGIVRALEQAESYREAASAASSDLSLSLVDGLDAPVIAGLLEHRRGAGSPGAVLVIAPTGRRAESLGPALDAVLPGAQVLLALYEGLAEYDPKTCEPRPGAAEKWTISPSRAISSWAWGSLPEST